MNDKDNDYRFDDDKDNEIEEYLERTLDELEKKPLPKKKSGTNVFSRLMKIYQEKKMPILWSTLGVLIVILIIALIITNIGGNDEDQKVEDLTENSSDQEESSQNNQDVTNESSFLAEPSDSKYNKLFESYFQNSLVQWNEAELAKCCESMQNVTESQYSYLNKYVESIENIVCYIGYETEDGKKLVYVTYNMKFENIETTMPIMEAYLLIEIDGQYKIHNFEVSEELDYYTSQVQDNQEYKDLKSNINNQVGIALESDENLKKVYNALKEVGN